MKPTIFAGNRKAPNVWTQRLFAVVDAVERQEVPDIVSESVHATS